MMKSSFSLFTFFFPLLFSFPGGCHHSTSFPILQEFRSNTISLISCGEGNAKRDSLSLTIIDRVKRLSKSEGKWGLEDENILE